MLERRFRGPRRSRPARRVWGERRAAKRTDDTRRFLMDRRVVNDRRKGV